MTRSLVAALALVLAVLGTAAQPAPRAAAGPLAAADWRSAPIVATDWSATAASLRGQNGAHFVFVCPAGGSIGSVWGTDIYTDDSRVCSAAVHKGLIATRNGGWAMIEIRPGQSSYTGSTRYGVTTKSYGSWSGSYVFVDGHSGGASGTDVMGAAGWSATARQFRGLSDYLTFLCPANGTAERIWGTNVYTDDSSVCTAGVHVGLITLAGGGQVTIRMLAGQTSYVGSTHNGIASASYGSWEGSFSFVGAKPLPAPGTTTPTTTTKPVTTPPPPAKASPVGLWRSGKNLYRWVAIRGSYEERSMTPHKLKRGCLVRAGDAVDRYQSIGNNLYRVSYRYWRARAGGPGADGLNCTTRWKAPEATVKIVVSGNRMTLSCDDEPGQVCYRYTRIGA